MQHITKFSQHFLSTGFSHGKLVF